MADKPLVGQADRPDLTVNTEGAGDRPRDLETVLGSSAASAQQLKQTPATAIDKQIVKEGIKDTIKDHKDPKEHKDQKDHKEPKDQKDQKEQKDQKDHKDPKEHKDQKDQKDPKEHKDQKDQKEHKDPKEHKDQKDIKDHKETLKDIKDGPKEVKEAIKEVKETIPEVATKATPEVGPGPVETLPPDEISQLVTRVSGLEQAVDDLKKKK